MILEDSDALKVLKLLNREACDYTEICKIVNDIFVLA